MALTPLKDSPSLNDLAYNQIKEAILTFQFLPNQALIEGELASQLGISKTPVRDALLQLELDGLVTRIPFKGTYVSEISNQDMDYTYEIRIVLEGLAIRLAAEALTEEDFLRLEELIREHEISLDRGDYARVAKINSEFHSVIIDRCSNPRLIKVLGFLDDNLKRYRLLSISQGFRKEKSIHEHRAIYEALMEHDPHKAEKAMRLHLESAMKDLDDQDFEELWRDLHIKA